MTDPNQSQYRHREWKCDECSGPAPGTGRFIEPKPLVDEKWLCDSCFEKAVRDKP